MSDEVIEAAEAAPAPVATPDPAPEPDVKPEPNSGAAPALSGKNEPAPVEEKPYWPEDWRERWAGKDEKMLARLKRFASPDNVFKSFVEADQKIRSGAFKQASLPENPSEREIADYRAAHGIPETHEGYFEHVKPPEGFYLDDNGKADLDFVFQKAHEANVPPSMVKPLADAFFARQMEAEAAMLEEAQRVTMDYRTTLKAEYGKEYVANIRLADTYMQKYAGDEAPALAAMTLADGTKLGDNPAFVRMMVNAARDSAGDTALVAAEYQASGKSMDDRYRELLNMSTSNDPNERKRYHSQEVQNELKRIVEARMRA